MRFHLIGNSHLDPVWLWDWREGLNEAITTCRTILRLMEEYPEMTYIRGEAVTYEHIARHDPATFARIREQIALGRWDVVGGSYLQPDTNLPATETLVRQYTRGLNYFDRHLGCRPTAAWAADSFGHSAGWPAIYAAAGMESFAFSRPQEANFPLPKPGFWWESDAGKRVLAWRIPIGWYGTDRDETTRRLDEFRKLAPQWQIENIAIFHGLGNHGGGPSRRQLEEIRRWSESNPDVEVVHSGLHRFFAALRSEEAAQTLPVIRGELNFTLRGCYASAGRFKAAYRRTENRLLAAEKTAAAIAGAGLAIPPEPLDAAWDAVLFNTFHDILPGTSIERAYEDQFAWLGVAHHAAQRAELGALNALAEAVDPSVPTPGDDMPAAVPVLVWNPLAWSVSGPIEIEVPLDYRPITETLSHPETLPVEVLGADGAPLPFQRTATEHQFCAHVAWRVRAIVPLTIPAMGWQIVRLSWNRAPRLAAPVRENPAASGAPGQIWGGPYRVEARVGEKAVHISRAGEAIFGAAGLTVATIEDTWGSWETYDDAPLPEGVRPEATSWQITRVETLESGPERASLWTCFEAGASRLELTFRVTPHVDSVEVVARLLWNERAARLKLTLPGEGTYEYEVPGGAVRRGDFGEVPGGRWVRGTRFAFLSDSIYNFDSANGALHATLVRSCRYAASPRSTPAECPERPYMDLGEHRFRMRIAPPDVDLSRLADELEQPPVVLSVPPGLGEWAGSGSLAELLCGGARILACKGAENDRGYVVRLQAGAQGEPAVRLRWQGAELALGSLAPWEIGTWHLTCARGKWSARLTGATA